MISEEEIVLKTIKIRYDKIYLIFFYFLGMFKGIISNIFLYPRLSQLINTSIVFLDVLIIPLLIGLSTTKSEKSKGLKNTRSVLNLLFSKINISALENEVDIFISSFLIIRSMITLLFRRECFFVE